MKSIFKRLRTATIMLAGVALIGGVSLACLPELKPAKELFAADEIVYFDEYENEFYVLINNERTYLSSMFCIDYYGNSISFEDGTATVVWKDDNLNSYTGHMENLVFGTMPTQNGQNYTGTLSGHLVEANSSFSNYPCPGPNLYYFDPNGVQWTFAGGGAEDDFFYEYDYLNYFEQTSTYKAKFAPIDGATGEDAIICEYTEGSLEAIFRTPIYASNASTGEYEYTGMSREFGFALTEAARYDDSDNTYLFRVSAGDTTNSFHVNAEYIGIVEGPAPEPPALSDLIWSFDTGRGCFITSIYSDDHYEFSLMANATSAVYDRLNNTVTATCTVRELSGSMPEEYSEAEISFTYVNAVGRLNDEAWVFDNCSCEDTEPETESIYFTVNVLSIKKLGWYYNGETLLYYAEENIEASWNIIYSEYRTEGDRNELLLYMDVYYNDEHLFPDYDVIQINNPDFGEVPYRGQTALGTIVAGHSDKLGQTISVQCNYAPFAYITDEWSYDAYHERLIYIPALNSEIEYELTSVTVAGTSYTLTYTFDDDSQNITVTDAFYSDEMLRGCVQLDADADITEISIILPESIVNPPAAYDEGWTYESDNQKLVYYLEEYGVFTLSDATHNFLDQVFTLSYVCQDQTMTIDIDYSGGEGGYDVSANTVSGYARLEGESSTAEFVTVLLEDSRGDTVQLLSANTWVYADNVGWVNANSNLVRIEDLQENMTSSIFYLAEGTSNQLCEIEYTYDGRVLPTLVIKEASYEEVPISTGAGVEYRVTGITDFSSGNTVEVTIPANYWTTRDLLPDYTVTFDGNGATGGYVEPMTVSPVDGVYTVELPDNDYTREGYTFKGWTLSPDGVITFQPGTQRIIDGDTIFYVSWVKSTFTISFDANGGTGEMSPMDYEKGYQDVPGCAFVRDGYTFAGWAVDSPTSGTVIQAGQSVYVDSDHTLYATWVEGTPEYQIVLKENEIVLYVDDTYIVEYSILPEGTELGLVWSVANERVCQVIEDGMIAGLSVGTTVVTVRDENNTTSTSFTVYVVERPTPVQPTNPIKEETIEDINYALELKGLNQEQVEQINDIITENQEYVSDEAGDIIYQALLGTTITSTDPDVAEAQRDLVVTVVETGVQVDAGKATSISDAQEIDKALPETASFSVEGEIEEFYQRQMAELFSVDKPSRAHTRAGAVTYAIDTSTGDREGAEAVDYLANEQALYGKMVDFVDTSVEHMGKSALKLRVCSGESVVVEVKSYVSIVKVSSFRDFDQEAADKEFVETVYKAILLSMQNEVISILERDHKKSSNAEKEAQYQKELEAVKDYETFEIMVTEVLRQKYVALTGEQIDDVEAFHEIYWEIFTAWALDKPSPYAITLEELTQTTIDESTSRANAFSVNADLTTGEWVYIGCIAGGVALIIAGFAVVPNILKKKRAKEGIN